MARRRETRGTFRLKYAALPGEVMDFMRESLLRAGIQTTDLVTSHRWLSKDGRNACAFCEVATKAEGERLVSGATPVLFQKRQARFDWAHSNISE